MFISSVLVHFESVEHFLVNKRSVNLMDISTLDSIFLAHNCLLVYHLFHSFSLILMDKF